MRSIFVSFSEPSEVSWEHPDGQWNRYWFPTLQEAEDFAKCLKTSQQASSEKA